MALNDVYFKRVNEIYLPSICLRPITEKDLTQNINYTISLGVSSIGNYILPFYDFEYLKRILSETSFLDLLNYDKLIKIDETNFKNPFSLGTDCKGYILFSKIGNQEDIYYIEYLDKLTYEIKNLQLHLKESIHNFNKSEEKKKDFKMKNEKKNLTKKNFIKYTIELDKYKKESKENVEKIKLYRNKLKNAQRIYSKTRKDYSRNYWN
jgi:hypothetical protein